MNYDETLLDKIRITALDRDIAKMELESHNIKLAKLIEKLPRTYYIRSYGRDGLDNKVLFIGTESECIDYVVNHLSMKVNGSKGDKLRQIVLITPQGGDPIAGELSYWTPLDDEYTNQYIYIKSNNS